METKINDKKKLYLEVLGNNEDMVIVKGKLMRPEPMEKKDRSGFYIVFEIKVVKESEGSKYDHQYNSYSVIVPSMEVKEMAPIIKAYKNCEVLAIIRPNARIRRGSNGGRFNSVDYYLDHIFLLEDYTSNNTSAGHSAGLIDL